MKKGFLLRCVAITWTKSWLKDIKKFIPHCHCTTVELLSTAFLNIEHFMHENVRLFSTKLEETF